MGYWVYELLDLRDHELMGSLIWFVGFMNFVIYMFLMDIGSTIVNGLIGLQI